MAAPLAPNALTSFLSELFSDLDKIKVATSHISMWGKPGSEDMTQIVLNALEFSYDLIRGTNFISDINPRSQIEAERNIGQNMKTNVEEVYQNVANLFPIINERTAVSHDQTFKRLAGQLAITKLSAGEMSALEKAATLLLQGVKIVLKKMAGRMNLVASEAIRTGIITLSDGSVYNFDRATANSGTVVAQWNNVSTATPIADLATLYEAVRDNGRCTPGFVGLGSDAAVAFFATDEITNLSNLRRNNFISGGRDLPALPPGYQRMIDNGWVYQAYLLTPQGYPLYIFVNNDNYQLANKTFTTFQPVKDVLMMDPAIRLDRFFGPNVRWNLDTPESMFINRVFGISNMVNTMPEQVSMGNVEPWMFYHYPEINSGHTSLQIESITCPVYVPTQVDGAGQIADATA